MAIGRTNAAGGGLKGIPLSSFVAGSIVRIKENGVLQDFYVARHGYPTAGNGRTLLVRRYTHSDRQWHSSNVNAYATCTLDAWFNGDYFNSLPADIRSQIAAVSIPYTPGNGSWSVSSLSRRVFALSGTELGASGTNMNTEGTALADAIVLRVAIDSSGTIKAQWTRSPSTANTARAWCLGTDGTPSDSNCGFTNSARPAFTLPSDILVYTLNVGEE